MKKLKDYFNLVKWALKVGGTTDPLKLAYANRILIQAIMMSIPLLWLLMILFFKI